MVSACLAARVVPGPLERAASRSASSARYPLLERPRAFAIRSTRRSSASFSDTSTLAIASGYPVYPCSSTERQVGRGEPWAVCALSGSRHSHSVHALQKHGIGTRISPSRSRTADERTGSQPDGSSDRPIVGRSPLCSVCQRAKSRYRPGAGPLHGPCDAGPAFLVDGTAKGLPALRPATREGHEMRNLLARLRGLLGIGPKP